MSELKLALPMLPHLDSVAGRHFYGRSLKPGFVMRLLCFRIAEAGADVEQQPFSGGAIATVTLPQETLSLDG